MVPKKSIHYFMDMFYFRKTKKWKPQFSQLIPLIFCDITGAQPLYGGDSVIAMKWIQRYKIHLLLVIFHGVVAILPMASNTYLS